MPLQDQVAAIVHAAEAELEKLLKLGAAPATPTVTPPVAPTVTPPVAPTVASPVAVPAAPAPVAPVSDSPPAGDPVPTQDDIAAAVEAVGIAELDTLKARGSAIVAELKAIMGRMVDLTHAPGTVSKVEMDAKAVFNLLGSYF